MNIDTNTSQATAQAGINIALVKYWGKRDVARNLPAVGSISLTVGGLGTTTTVQFSHELQADVFELNGTTRPDRRVTTLLDGIRRISGETRFASVSSKNSVPTGSGLASSASGAAALSVAAWCAAGLPADKALSDSRFLELVRIGSGSAPRSLLGGLVELDLETTGVTQLLAPNAWDLRMIVARLTNEQKEVSSRDGMERTARTSSYYDQWVEQHPRDLDEARHAIASKDLAKLGAVMERSTMRMHACMLAADPPLRYWKGATLVVADAVESLRKNGIGAWYTMDAGPHVKILCEAQDETTVLEALGAVVAPEDLFSVKPGPGAEAWRT